MDAIRTKRTIIEEWINTITHGIGVGLSIAALILLLVTCRQCEPLHVVSYLIYGISLILLYTSSTIYHSVITRKLKDIFNKVDHSAIYLLIAGTYTPFALVTLNGVWGWTIFGVIWALALAGVIYKMFFYTDKYRVVSSVMYMVMGWIILFAIKPLVNNLSADGLMWLGIGALSYSLGVIFYLWRRLPFSHGIWHLFVLGGSISHFFAIFYYV